MVFYFISGRFGIWGWIRKTKTLPKNYLFVMLIACLLLTFLQSPVLTFDIFMRNGNLWVHTDA